MLPARKIISVLFLSFFVIVGGFLLWSVVTGEDDIADDQIITTDDQTQRDEISQTEESAKIPEREQVVIEQQANITNLEKALQNNDESECHNITEQRLRIECFDRARLAQAVVKNDITLCEALNDSARKQYCRNQVLANKAVDTKNTSLCLQISETYEKEQCLDRADTEIFMTALTAADCEKIYAVSEKEKCVDHFLFRQIHTENSNEFCAEFFTSEGQEKCENYFWNQQAVAEKDPTLCVNITDDNEQKKCEASMKLIVQNDERSQALMEGKSEHCASFLDEQLKQQCINEAHYYAARLYRDVKYCAKITSSAFASRCEQEVNILSDQYWLQQAQEGGNTEYCDNIQAIDTRDNCLETAA